MAEQFRPTTIAGDTAEPQNQTRDKQARNRKLARFGIVFAILGLLLFAYFVRKTGVLDIMSGIRRLGFGFRFQWGGGRWLGERWRQIPTYDQLHRPTTLFKP